ncbi:MAG: glycoside hydrolase family 32 protein, partial [Limisphaerales bacterium]
NEIWSGCCTINRKGEPMIFYTSIGRGKSAMDHAEQWAAIGDDDLIQWRKSPANPVLSEELHGATKIYDWRDPFIFREKNRTFMVLGGNLNKGQGGQAVVNIYEAQNGELTKWKYRGVLFQHPDPKAATVECPNFFKLGDQWVLLLSPYGEVQYFVGDFDATTCRFQARTRGVMDQSRNFYAPNTLQTSDGRRIAWGWIMGFPNGHGWNGVLSLPRLLSLSPDGKLLQKPAPPLEKLRDKPVERKNVRLENRSEIFALPKTNTLEILAEIDLQTAKSVGLKFKSSGADAKPITVSFDRAELHTLDTKVPLQFTNSKKKLGLRIFFDRSTLEIFANDEVCITKMISPLDSNATLEIFADDGKAA